MVLPLSVTASIVYCVLICVPVASSLHKKNGGERLEYEDSKVSCSVDEDCPPWLSCQTQTCKCRNIKNDYPDGILKCDDYTGELYVLDCNCATYDDEHGLVAGHCVENCMTDSDKSYDTIYHPLPINTSEINTKMCGRFNRTGRLCGECLPGYTSLAYSFDLSCVNCTNSSQNVWMFLLVAFVPVTCFYYFILFFKINATLSHLHGFVLFCQAVSLPAFSRILFISIKHHAPYQLPVKVAASLYGFWNLDFFRMLVPGFCLDLSNISILALDYAIGVYPILLTILSYILIKLHDRNFKPIVFIWKPFRYLFTLFRRNWDIRTSVIDAYATFYLLSFFKIVSTTFDLLIPTYAYSLEGRKLVLYYDGSIDYFGRDHLPYAILAIFATIFATLPILLLLFYPCRCFHAIFSRYNIRCHGYRLFNCKVLHILMDSIQRSYKDGTEPGTRDCRWFAGLYLILRIVLYITWSFTLDGLFLPLATVILLIFLVIAINIQPHKTAVAHYNKINMTFIIFLTLYYTGMHATNLVTVKAHKLWKGCTILTSIAGALPFFYMSCIAIYWITTRRRWGKVFVDRIRTMSRRNLEESLPDRICNPENYAIQATRDDPEEKQGQGHDVNLSDTY